MEMLWSIHRQVHDDCWVWTVRLPVSPYGSLETKQQQKKVENVFFLSVRIHLQIKASSLRQSFKPLDYVESEY